LRRIALRAGDRRQVNLLAVGSLSASELYAILRGRWVQENGFHHQVHRWGINQLDGRTTAPYDPDAVIPNPARRRLDRNVRLARVTAGLARNELAVLAKNDPRRGRWDAILTRATTREQDLLALRPTTPTRAPLRETELADKLVRHSGDYKMALDSVRIACANVESDLAAILAETMVLPARTGQKGVGQHLPGAQACRGRPVRHYRPTCPGRQPHRARRNCQLVRPLQPAETHPAGRPRHAPTPLSGPKYLRRPARTLGRISRGFGCGAEQRSARSCR